MPLTGDTQMRDQAVDKDRRKFTAGLIRAIEELELRRTNRTPQQLADAAWHKLQYDYPLVETAELQALLDAFSASFVGKAGWPCYLLTHKALDNISSGARGGGSCAPALSEQEQQVQQILAASLSQKLSQRPGSSTPQAQQQQQQQPVSQRQLYQQLAAVLLLQYAAKVASLPQQEAWQLLQDYCLPEDDQHAQPCQQGGVHDDSLSHDSGAAVGAGAAAAVAAAAGLGPAAATNGISGSSSCSIYEDTEAAQQDGDSEEYEPLEAAAALAQQHHQHQSTGWSGPACPSRLHPHPQQQQQQDPQPYSWPALHAKLMSLAEHVHYSLLSHEPLWQQQGGAAQHLLQLLRLLGVHGHAQELQPLLHAYVGLLVDRLAAAPQDLPLLHQLWEALGLTAGSGLHQARARRGAHSTQQAGQQQQQQQQQGLWPEAVLGLSVAAAVWQQLPGASAHKQLWRLMHADLLPLLEVCAEQLAYNSSSNSSKAQASSNSANGTAGSACMQGVAIAHVLLLSHVVELLVLGRPGHVDVGQQLTEAGLTRSLVQLHVTAAAEPAAEPLRRVMLLACCSSPHTTAWVLAVPGVRQQLQQQPFQLEAACEAHGALWQLLTHSCVTPQQAKTAAGDADAGQQQLLSLLSLSSSNLQQLQRQVVALQLMVDAQRAAGSRQRLWSEPVCAALRKLAAQFKEVERPAGSDAQAAAAGSKACLSSGDSDSDAEPVDCTPAGQADGGEQQQQGVRQADTQQMQHRRSAQLQPAALRLVKELLTHGGGKTD